MRTNTAKYYLYRNLHKNQFSIRYKGLVIKHINYQIMKNVEFKVSEKGRKRVLKEKQKNVHAMVAGDLIEEINESCYEKEEIYYNPYITPKFIIKNTGMEITNCDLIMAKNNKIYLWVQK